MSRVSIIIPAYNQAGYLAEAVASALGQTHADVEVVVVDDGSTDATPEVCARFAADARVRTIRTENGGVAAARNRGVSEASGAYVCFLDADDRYHPTKIAKQAAVLDAEPAVAFVYCDIVEIDESGAPVDRCYSVGRERQLLTGDITASLMRGGYFPPHVVMVRRDALAAIGGFDPALGGHADLDLWLRLAASGNRAAYLDEKLADYRFHSQSMSRDLGAMLETRTRTYAKLARSHPEAMAGALVSIQQLDEDVHLGNRWLRSALDDALKRLEPPPGIVCPLIDVFDRAVTVPAGKAALWDATIDGASNRAIVLHPPATLQIIIPQRRGGRLHGAVALHPDVWDNPRSGPCEFEVGADGRVAWRASVDPAAPRDRHWIEFTLDVSSSEADHEFTFATRGVGGNSFRWALWRAPEFVAAA
jgi:glycosyltransferase involved in cell wall biosynthesis